jgi:hypothetical protein
LKVNPFVRLEKWKVARSTDLAKIPTALTQTARNSLSLVVNCIDLRIEGLGHWLGYR